MKFSVFIIVLVSFLFMFSTGFKEAQLKNSRVKTAVKEKQFIIDKSLKNSGLSVGLLNIFIRVLKKEELLELWEKDANSNKYKQIVTYPFCAFSGELGPKRRQGDLQIPEGFY